MEKQRTKFWVTCGNCGERQMEDTSTEIASLGADRIIALECEVCGHIQPKPSNPREVQRILQAAPTPDQLNEAMTQIFQASQVIQDGVGASAFFGAITIDRGGNDLGAADFYIGDAESMLAGLVRLLTHRPELMDLVIHAVSTAKFNVLSKTINEAYGRGALIKQAVKMSPERVAEIKELLRQANPRYRANIVEAVPDISKHIDDYKNFGSIVVECCVECGGLDGMHVDRCPILRNMRGNVGNYEHPIVPPPKAAVPTKEMQDVQMELIQKLRVKWFKKGRGAQVKEVFREYGIGSLTAQAVYETLRPEQYNEVINKLNNIN